MTEVHMVQDRRGPYVNWVCSWRTEPLEFDKLSEKDIGRTIIYQKSGRPAEAGTITSWKDGIVFALYTRGIIEVGAQADKLSFGLERL